MSLNCALNIAQQFLFVIYVFVSLWRADCVRIHAAMALMALDLNDGVSSKHILLLDLEPADHCSCSNALQLRSSDFSVSTHLWEKETNKSPRKT